MSDFILESNKIKQYDSIIERNFYIKTEDGRYALVCRPTMVSESCRYCNTPAEKMRRNGYSNIMYFGCQNKGVIQYDYVAKRLRCPKCQRSFVIEPDELRGIKYLYSYLQLMVKNTMKQGISKTMERFSCNPRTVKSLMLNYSEWFKRYAFYKELPEKLYFGIFSYMDYRYIHASCIDTRKKMYPIAFFVEKEDYTEVFNFIEMLTKHGQKNEYVVLSEMLESFQEKYENVKLYRQSDVESEQDMMLFLEEMKIRRLEKEEYLRDILILSPFVQIPEFRNALVHMPKQDEIITYIKAQVDSNEENIGKKIADYLELEAGELQKTKFVDDCRNAIQNHEEDLNEDSLRTDLNKLIDQFEESFDRQYQKFLLEQLQSETEGEQRVHQTFGDE